MGRPIKNGLDYFPLDCNFFNDGKIKFVFAKYGATGEVIAIKLLCKIYQNGYYCEWDEDEEVLLSTYADKNATPEIVKAVIQELIKRNMFSRDKFDTYHILTSNGIQKRFLQICRQLKRSPRMNPNFTISDETIIIASDNNSFHGITTAVNGINSFEKYTKEKKEKERKGKEIKRKEIKGNEIKGNMSAKIEKNREEKNSPETGINPGETPPQETPKKWYNVDPKEAAAEILRKLA